MEQRTESSEGGPDLAVAPSPGGWRRLVPFLTVAAMVALADQGTKLAVVVFLAENESVPAAGILRLTHVTNTGSAFGLLQGQTAFLILASFIGIFGIVAYYRANGQRSLALRLALGLVLGGALGNLTDRLLRGSVVDFVDVQLWPGHHWPAFNLADSALLLGLGLLGLYVMRQRPTRARPPEAPALPLPPSPAP